MCRIYYKIWLYMYVCVSVFMSQAIELTKTILVIYLNHKNFLNQLKKNKIIFEMTLVRFQKLILARKNLRNLDSCLKKKKIMFNLYISYEKICYTHGLPEILYITCLIISKFWIWIVHWWSSQFKITCSKINDTHWIGIHLYRRYYLTVKIFQELIYFYAKSNFYPWLSSKFLPFQSENIWLLALFYAVGRKSINLWNYVRFQVQDRFLYYHLPL